MENKEQQIEELLTRGVAEVIDKEHLKQQLLSGKKLRIKLGIDPTSANIHIGRAVVLQKMRDFQELGHTIVLIVGDFTGVIGDTSDKESERPMLSSEQIEKNMQTYKEQLGMIIDLTKAEVHYNSEWLGKLTYKEIGEQANAFSLAEFIARENIKKRLDAGKAVSLREVLYPMMQGFDSVAIHADVEFGGTDQRFNLLAGRRLQETYHEPAQDILMMNLIPGTDGRKMSSSWGNTINLLDTPQDMFGKVMRVPDEIMMTYFTHCTRVPMKEVASLAEEIVTGKNPRDIKIRLAREIVALYHGEEKAKQCEEYFVATFSQGQIPEDVREVRVVEGSKMIDMIAENGLAESKSDARRKIEQGAVSLDQEKILDIQTVLDKRFENQVLRIGKKDFIRILFR